MAGRRKKDYYDIPENVETYCRMAEGYSGSNLVRVLKRHLLPEADVLEIGMGPGTDLDQLKRHFKVVGSDRSQVFLDRYRKKHPDQKLLRLEAMSLRTRKHFDAIYSNKVLHHLTDRQLARSFERQYDILRPEGLALHSFWYGEGEYFENDLRVVLRTENDVIQMVAEIFDVVEIGRYKEITRNDSFFVLLQRLSD
ncbi:MAG: class I SAM-dependent methyltransferase [Rhodothermales bacterium]|nr:class I SAM-dependent methyltransferase [Rhodothermales bacterium]